LARFSVKDSLETHAFESLDYTRGSTKDRVELWSRTLTLVSEKPLLGHGLGSWKINMLQFGNEDLASENNTSFYQRPHNDFLWLAAEQGLLGLALYLFVFLTVIGKGLKVFFKNNQQGLSGFTWAVASVTIAFLVYSCLGFPKERIAHNIFLFTAWGLFLNRSRPQGGEGEREGTGEKNPFQWPVFILLAGLVVLGLFRLNGEIHAKKAILAKKSGRYQRCVQEISRARSFVYQLDETSTPLSWYAGFSHFKTGQYSKALPHFEEAYQANPYHLHVLNDYAGCLAKTGRARQAKKYYRQALGVAPNYSPARLNLCAIYFNQGQYALAYETLKKLDANDPSPRYKKTVKVILQTILLEQLNSTRQNTAVFHHVQEQNHYAFYKQLLHGLKNHDIQYESIAKYTIDTFQEPKNN
jgi:tetratricopeptide (TPR) repeat protein